MIGSNHVGVEGAKAQSKVHGRYEQDTEGAEAV